MKRLAHYPDYKDSGFPWIGKIPAHWGLQRSRYLFREVDRRSTHGKETHLSMSQVHGLVPSSSLSRKSLQSASYAGGKLVDQNDLVLNRLKAHLGVFARASQAGVVSPDYSVFRPSGVASVQYCERLFKTPMYVGEFRRRTKGIVEGFWRLYTDDFYAVPAVLPPKSEQDQIVAYLRAQDAHIARFIKAKRDLIALLNEQKLRITDQAVTRGLDASSAMRPSGIEWLGDAPAHWRPSRLGDCIQVCRSGAWGVEPTDKNVEDHLVCVRVADFDTESLKVATTKLTVRAVTQSERFGRLLSHGDLLLEKSGGGEKTPVGRVVAFDLDQIAVCSNFLSRLVPNRQLVRSDYLLLLLNHLHARRVVVPFIKQTTGIQNLNSKAYFKLGVVLPSLEEQDELLKVLRSACDPIESAIGRAELEIQLLREFRDRQIADVVTGQIDVRSWQPGPDDLTTEEDLTALGDDDENTPTEEETDGHEQDEP